MFCRTLVLNYVKINQMLCLFQPYHSCQCYLSINVYYNTNHNKRFKYWNVVT